MWSLVAAVTSPALFSNIPAISALCLVHTVPRFAQKHGQGQRLTSEPLQQIGVTFAKSSRCGFTRHCMWGCYWFKLISLFLSRKNSLPLVFSSAGPMQHSELANSDEREREQRQPSCLITHSHLFCVTQALTIFLNYSFFIHSHARCVLQIFVSHKAALFLSAADKSSKMKHVELHENMIKKNIYILVSKALTCLCFVSGDIQI